MEEGSTDFTYAELAFALSHTNAKATEGKDGVSVRFILEAGAAAREFFLCCCKLSSVVGTFKKNRFHRLSGHFRSKSM